MSRHKKTHNLAEVDLHDEDPTQQTNEETVPRAESAQFRVMQYPEDFKCKYTTWGEQVLYCIWCNKLINTKSSRVSEHVKSMKHLENKGQPPEMFVETESEEYPESTSYEMTEEEQGTTDPYCIVDQFSKDLMLAVDSAGGNIEKAYCKFCPNLEIESSTVAIDHICSKMHMDAKINLNKDRMRKSPPKIRQPPTPSPVSNERPPTSPVEEDEDDGDYYKIRGTCALLSDLQVQKKRNGVTDLQFICSDGKLFSYKAILCFHSSFFRQLVFEMVDSRDLLTVLLPDFNCSLLRRALDLLQNKTVTFTNSTEILLFKELYQLLVLDLVPVSLLDFQALPGFKQKTQVNIIKKKRQRPEESPGVSKKPRSTSPPPRITAQQLSSALQDTSVTPVKNNMMEIKAEDLHTIKGKTHQGGNKSEAKGQNDRKSLPSQRKHFEPIKSTANDPDFLSENDDDDIIEEVSVTLDQSDNDCSDEGNETSEYTKIKDRAEVSMGQSDHKTIGEETDRVDQAKPNKKGVEQMEKGERSAGAKETKSDKSVDDNIENYDTVVENIDDDFDDE